MANPESPESSKTVQDYLLSVYTLSSDGRSVIAARLAEALEVAPPTVTATLHRMTRDGLVTVNQNKEISLTDAGQARAETMVRRHRLAERLLSDILGLDWAEVHEEAHHFEHVISPRVEERILEILGNPTTCPHGSPIPGTGARQSPDATRLESVQVGSRVVIERVSEQAEGSHELLSYFERAGLLPGREFDIQEIEPSNELMVLQGDGESVPVGMAAAHTLWVRVLASDLPLAKLSA